MPFKSTHPFRKSSESSESSDSEQESYDKSTLEHLIAQYGSSSSTSWLEFSRYKIWRPSYPIPESDFLPAQGYMRKDRYVFAWGNPIVSHVAALRPTAHAFSRWVEAQDLRLVWCCVDQDLEQVLAEPPFEWSIVSPIYEDVVDPAHVMYLTSPEALGKEGGASVVKDLRKNLKRAERAEVEVKEVLDGEWTEEERRAVEQGVEAWRKAKSGLQIASSTVQPWLDAQHRRYWLAQSHGKAVGIIILTRNSGNVWQIKNALSFPDAPRGTSELLIYTAIKDLHEEQERRGRNGQEPVSLTFGISASEDMQPVTNLSGWGVTALAKLYGKVAHAAGLLRRGEFRHKFDSRHIPRYVCYPEDGFGLDGVNALLKVLKK